MTEGLVSEFEWGDPRPRHLLLDLFDSCSNHSTIGKGYHNGIATGTFKIGRKSVNGEDSLQPPSSSVASSRPNSLVAGLEIVFFA
jgi:hypothetical protein